MCTMTCRIARVCVILVPLLMLMGDGHISFAQQKFPSVSPASHTEDDEPRPLRGPSRKLKLMKQSFEQTQKDTAELYDLATQLKEEVQKADEDTLSLTVMKKAEEVEKLAGKIKNRMKNM